MLFDFNQVSKTLSTLSVVGMCLLQGFPEYWLSGSGPSCPRSDCGVPVPTPGAEYGNFPDTRFQSSFFFGCQDTFKLAGQTDRNDNVVRCQSNGVWDFGDLRCEGPVCQDPGRPVDGYQLATSYEQVSLFLFHPTYHMKCLKLLRFSGEYAMLYWMLQSELIAGKTKIHF